MLTAQRRYPELACPGGQHITLFGGGPLLIGYAKGLVRNNHGKTSGTGMV
jgi:hypothetical protein